MDLHQQQQFGFLLQTATERFVTRLEERFRGADEALREMKRDAAAYRARVDEFTDAIFEDFLLNNADGACFILRSLPKRKVELANPSAQTIETILVQLAKQAFADLLGQKTEETLEQHSGYQSV